MTTGRSKRLIIMFAPLIGLIAGAGAIYWLLIVRREHRLVGLLASELDTLDLLWCALGVLCSLGILFVFLKVVPMRQLYDPNVRALADSFSQRFLTVYYIPNAFYEELIFRGALQPVIGLIPAALLFTAVHVSYYKKPVLLLEVFLQGIVLGLMFDLTGSVWITTLAHTAVNAI